MRAPQLNIYHGDSNWILTQYDGFVPRVDEKVVIAGEQYIVSDVVYEFDDGGPFQRLAHVHVELVGLLEEA